MAESHSPTTTNHNLQIKERQILVDPISLRESSSRREPSFNLMLPRIESPPDGPPPLPPPLLSCSLQNSACSSPRFSFALIKKKWKHESHASPRQIDRLAYRHSAAHCDCDVQQQDEVTLRRSKSCAEGRRSPPVDELDFLFTKPNSQPIQFNIKLQETKREVVKKTDANQEEEFKCSALCIYLPGFGKGKLVRSKKELTQEEVEVGGVISRTVSLEKFECGSWASSAIMNDYELGGDGGYFDLPLELIQSSGNETNSPVSAAFIFDKDRKGVLKKNGSRRGARGRKSCESDPQVRFSTSSSSPSCITPRLRKARDDFNAFLEAQAA